jgi:hypothetical protein
MSGYPPPATLAAPALAIDRPPHSSGQDVTIAYPKRSERKKLTVLLEINSRDRNVKQYPNSANFRWRLFRPLKDIVSIQISGGAIPSKLYNLNCGWNSFTFVEDGIRYNLTLTPGYYTYQSLSIAIADLLNGIAGKKNSYTVQFSSSTGKMILTKNHGIATFGLLFATGDYVDLYDQNNTLQMVNSPAKLWGFTKADYYNDPASGSLTSPFSADIDFLLNRIYVYLNNDNNQDIGTIERSAGRQQPHAIIYMDECCGNYKYLNKETFEPTYLAWPAAISRTATIEVSLRDEFDRLIDLNGRDFTLLLEVVFLD